MSILPPDLRENQILEDVGEGPIAAEVAEAVVIEAESSDGRTIVPSPSTVETEAVRPSPPRRIELVRVPFVVDSRYRSARIKAIVEQANRDSAQAARGPSPSSSK